MDTPCFPAGRYFRSWPLRNFYPQKCREEACWGKGKVVAAGEMHWLNRGEPVFSRWCRPYLLGLLTLWFPGKAQHGLWSHSRYQKPLYPQPRVSHHVYEPQIHRSNVAFVMESRKQKAWDWDSGFSKEVCVECSDGEGAGIWVFDLGIRAWGCLECVLWGLALLSFLYHLILQNFKFPSWFHSRKCNHQSVACCLSLPNCMSSIVSLTVDLESYSIVIKWM